MKIPCKNLHKMSKILLLPLQNFTVLYFFALCAIIAVICVCAFLSAAIHLRTPLHEKEAPDVKTVQRILLWILFVVVLCAALIGGVFYYLYDQTVMQAKPPVLTFAGQDLPCTSYHWEQPVLGGIMTRPFDAQVSAVPLETLTSPQVRFEAPEDGSCEIKLYYAEEKTPLFAASGSADWTLTKNGDYRVEILYTQAAKDRNQGSGWFRYDVPFTLDAEPSVTLSAESLPQGGVVCVTVTGILDDSVPTIQSDLCPAVFVNTEQGTRAYLAAAYNREPGEYTITVTCAGRTFTPTVQVIHQDWPNRTTTPSDTGGSLTEWQNAIFPTYDLMTPEKLWDGVFQVPISTQKTAEYGEYLRGADGTLIGRSAGIGYATGPGATVCAGAGGKVAYAGTLSMTGGTVVIDHGAGLKSYYYYLGEVSCSAGQSVAGGDVIGKTGSADLHYEARIGNQSLNPELLFSEQSPFFR